MNKFFNFINILNKSIRIFLLYFVIFTLDIDINSQALINYAQNNFFICQPSAISFSPDNEYIAISNLGGNFLTIFALENGEYVFIRNYYSQYFSKLSSVSFTPDSSESNGYYIVISDFFQNNYNSQLLLFKFDPSTYDITFISYTNGSQTKLDPLSIAFSPNFGTPNNPSYFIAVSYVGSGVVDIFSYDPATHSISVTNNSTPVASGAIFTSVSFAPINGNNNSALLATDYYDNSVNTYLIDANGNIQNTQYVNPITNGAGLLVNPIGVTVDNNNNVFVTYYDPSTNTNGLVQYMGSYETNGYVLQSPQYINIEDIVLANPFGMTTNNNNLYICNLTPIPKSLKNNFELYFNIYNINYGVSPLTGSIFYQSAGVFGTNKLASCVINNTNYIYVSNIAKYLLLEAPSLDAFSIFKYNPSSGIEYLATILDVNLRSPSAIVTVSNSIGNYLFIANSGFNSNFGNGYYISMYIINPDGTVSPPRGIQFFIDDSYNNQYINNPSALAVSSDNNYLFIGNKGNPGQSFISVYDINQVLTINNTNFDIYVYNPENVYILDDPSSMFVIPNSNILVVVNKNANFISVFNYSGSLKDGSFSIEYNPAYSSLFSQFISYCPYINSLSLYTNNNYQYFLATNLNNSLTFSLFNNQNLCFLNNYGLLSNLISPNDALFLSQYNNSTLNYLVSNMNNNLVIVNFGINNNNCSIENALAGQNKVFINQNNILPNLKNINNISFNVTPQGAVLGYGTNYKNNIVYSTLTTTPIAGQISIDYQFNYINSSISYFVNGLYLININPIASSAELQINKNGLLFINLNDLEVGTNLSVSYTQPRYGNVYYNNSNNTLLYVPNVNFTGIDSFVYTLTTSDGLLSSSATIDIFVSP